MRGVSGRNILVVGVVVAAMGAARPAAAQCAASLTAMSNISPTPANPFQAVRATTRSGRPESPKAGPQRPADLILTRPQMVARDSQGRIRMDRAGGRLLMETGPDAGKQVEDHTVQICDPVAGTTTELDTANKTAKVRQLFPRGAPHAAPAPNAAEICTVPAPMKNSPDYVIEDLGHRVIEGFDTQGMRITMRSLQADTVRQIVHEQWCSVELGAVLLSSVGRLVNGPRQEVALTKIQRTEPDAALFQIPPDYTVSQAETQAPARQ